MSADLSGVRAVGGLLTGALLSRVAALDPAVPGLTPADYGLAKSARLRSSVEASWQRLTGAWKTFATARAQLPEGDRATDATRRFLLAVAEELGYEGVQRSLPISAGGREYAVSHSWRPATTPVGADEDAPVGNDVLLHLLGAGLDLDRRNPGAAGAARQAPHAMVQQLLNATDDYLWGHLSNGLVWRVLRDNVAMSRQSYVEFDLQGMFEGEQYADFVVFWLLCHRSRVHAERPELCWLEKWTAQAEADGSRALDKLRIGVEKALQVLGTGFLSHTDNVDLRRRLSPGEDGGPPAVSKDAYWRQLLRLVYQLLFVLVAEERDVLLLREGDAKPAARQTYQQHYSIRRLRELARTQSGSAHPDLWEQLRLVLDRLGSTGEPALALPPLGGQLFGAATTGVLRDSALSNDHLLEALRHLCFVRGDKGGYAAVDYKNLGAEELGSVYESLLELHPTVDVARKTFTIGTAAGNERKTTGAYYTPTQLIAQLCDTALEPVLADAMADEDPEAALLAVTVCDPSCGSGHFLVAAAQRIATRLAQVRAGELVGEGEVTPGQVAEAMRDVVSHCIYGVDINPMAVELAKVSLWLEAHVPGQPLTFLDHHIKHGNSLLGATPALISRGIPDGAFKPIEGDDKAAATAFKKRNRLLREGQQSLLFAAEPVADYDALADQVAAVEAMEDHDLAGLEAKARRFAEVQRDRRLRRLRLAADAWCAAFTAPKVTDAEDAHPFEAFYDLRDGTDDHVAGIEAVEEEGDAYAFFHWHLEFPHLYRPVDAVPGNQVQPDDHLGWTGGFTVLLGNPPWEHTELKEKEWFAARDDAIANAPTGAARKRLIAALADKDPALYAAFQHAKREHDNYAHFSRGGRYPLTATGRTNTYALFAELFRDGIAENGRAGVIVPTGIATDHTTRHFFADLVDSKRLASVFDFENRLGIFPAVDSRMKFALLTISGVDAAVEEAEFAFFAHDTADLRDPDRRFVLTPEDIALINPNTKTAPVFRTSRDAEITAKIYRNVPVLVREGDPDGNPWGVTFRQGLFNMTSDSHLFHTREELEADGWTLRGNVFEKRGGGVMVPLVEAKMIHHFDTRWATYEPDGSTRRMTDPEKVSRLAPMPRYWVPEVEVTGRLEGRWDKPWLLGWRRIGRSTDERSLITSLLPRVGVGDSIFLVSPQSGRREHLQAAWSSPALDYVVRQKLGGTNLNFFMVEQLPVPPPSGRLEGLDDEWVSVRVDRLNGWVPDAGERAVLRAELDAYYFHLYGLDRQEVDYVMDTFPIVRRKDEEAYGEYRTKQLVLAAYDDLAVHA